MILFRDEPNNLLANVERCHPQPGLDPSSSRPTGPTNGVAVADIISDITRLTPLHSTQCTFLPTAGPRAEKYPISNDTPTVNTTEKSTHGFYHFIQGHNKTPI